MKNKKIIMWIVNILILLVTLVLFSKFPKEGFLIAFIGGVIANGMWSAMDKEW